MRAESWIGRTGQRGKALVTLGISCVAPAVAVFAFAMGAVYLAIALLALAVLAFVAFATTVRCPECKKSISWMVLSTRPSSLWLTDLFGLQECPSCDGGKRSG
jgi:hypothetical protein